MAESLEAKVARLCERSESLLREVHDQADDFKKLALDIGMVLQEIGELHALKDDVARILAAQEKANKQREREAQDRAAGRNRIVLAVIAASATVLAAVIGAAAVILSAHS